jgi:hypothetical protein
VNQRLYLHIGAFKTGTSYLQGVLGANAEELRQAGVLVAPNRSAAVHDAVDFRGRGRAHLRSVRGSWSELIESARSYDGGATVLSHEYLSLQGPQRVDRLLASMGDLEPHVVLTVRDAAAVLPAQWQTSARNRGTLTWPAFVEAARDPATKPRSHTFLVSQRIGTLLRMWRNKIGVERVHVVTVPAPDAPRTLLWDRFASVLGVDPSVARTLDVPSNPSAGYATAHLLCLVHGRAARRGLPRQQVQRMAVFAAHRAAARRHQEPTPPLDLPTREFAAAWNREVKRVVLRSRVEVVGDLADLVPRPDPAAARPLLPPADDDVLAAARGVAATLGLLVDRTEAPDGWSSVREAVGGIVDLMAEAAEAKATDRLNARGTELRAEG